ncbi:MAG TPA: hypothetical protein VNE83_03900 [Terriglobales bacterium]|nr:hypothetical protein [Terriglobales bacterium]
MPETPASPPIPAPATPPATVVRPRASRAPRGFWLRLTLFATLLGAVLTLLYAWVWAPDGGGSGRVLIAVLAAVTVAGVLLLDRAATTGLVLMVAATGVGLGSGTAWLAPGVVLAAVWAARRSRRARRLLGFLLLLPGIAGGYYGAVGTMGWISHVPVDGLVPNLGQPLGLAQALAPLELLPLALLGAWLLAAPGPIAQRWEAAWRCHEQSGHPLPPVEARPQATSGSDPAKSGEPQSPASK